VALEGHVLESTVCISVSVLTAILPDEPGLAGFIDAKDNGSGADNLRL